MLKVLILVFFISFVAFCSDDHDHEETDECSCFEFSHNHSGELVEEHHEPKIEYVVGSDHVLFNASVCMDEGFVAIAFNSLDHLYRNALVVAAFKNGSDYVVRQYMGDSELEKADFVLDPIQEIEHTEFHFGEEYTHIEFCLPLIGNRMTFNNEDIIVMMMHDDEVPTGNILHDHNHVHVTTVNLWEENHCDEHDHDDEDDEDDESDLQSVIALIEKDVMENAMFWIGLVFMVIAFTFMVIVIIVFILEKKVKSVVTEKIQEKNRKKHTLLEENVELKEPVQTNI